MIKNHALVNTPMRGPTAKWQLATVTNGSNGYNGKYLGKTVCIMVEFSDGWCICDMCEDEPIEIISIDDMRLWISVDSIG